MHTHFGLKASLVTALLVTSTLSFPANKDQAIVAALDTTYQAAVKNKDAAAMARILADDFVLVTGNGKTYGKNDLLSEAHGETVYERQEDSQQTVLVWGNIAIVTALLGPKVKARMAPSITNCGSATSTCARQQVGVIRSVKLRCGSHHHPKHGRGVMHQF